MDKRALSRIPRPTITAAHMQFAKLVPNMEYLVTAEQATVNGTDTLILNFFGKEKKGMDLNASFRVFCQKNDYISQDLTQEKIRWKTGALDYLAGYIYWQRNSGNICIASEDEQQLIYQKMMEWQGIAGPNPYALPTDAVDEYKGKIKERRLAKRHQEEKDRIDARMAKFGELPGDYNMFVEETVFKDENYIFYSLQKKTAYCTKCKHHFIIDGKKHLIGDGIPIWNDRDIVKHNKTVRCPWCNSYLQCKSVGMGRQGLMAVKWSVLLQKDGEDVLIRYFRHVRDFRGDFYKPKVDSTEMFRTIHTAEKAEDYEWYRFKSTYEIRWCYPKGRNWGYFQPSEYDVPRSVALYNQDLKAAVEGTCMKYSSIDLYVEHVLDDGRGGSKPWFVDWYFNAYRRSPFLEQMLKVGFYKMTREFLEDHNAPELANGRSILDTLGINKIQYNMLRRLKDPSLRDLEILKYKPGLSWDDFNTLRYIKDGGHYRMYRKFGDFMQYTTLHKLTRYISEQKISHEHDYFDYAEWTEKVGYDMHNEFNLFPRDFKRAHDARMREYEKFKDKQEREAAKRFNILLKKLKEETADVEALNLRAGSLFIRLPREIEELKAEGEVLHHCVGTYSEKVRKGETMIFFIRLVAEPEKPFYTLEWKGKVAQCRGFKNCDMTPEVKAFVDIFEKKMQEYESIPGKKRRKAGRNGR